MGPLAVRWTSPPRALTVKQGPGTLRQPRKYRPALRGNKSRQGQSQSDRQQALVNTACINYNITVPTP